MEKTEFKTINLNGSVMNVKIENGKVAVYIVDGGSGEGVVVPMSYCYIEEIDSGDSVIGGETTFALNMKGEPAYADRNRYIKFLYSSRRVKDDVLTMYCLDGDLYRPMKKFLHAIERINYEYLESHGSDIAAIQDISKTVSTVNRAAKIISKTVA